MKKKIFRLSILTLLISINSFSQQIDFKLKNAIKSSELTIERSFGSDLLNEVDILPEGKKYLIIIGEAINKEEQTIRVKSENVTLGDEKNKAIGYLKPSSRADVQWGYKGDLWKGSNYFTAIFIVSSELSETILNINEQSFKINKIEDSSSPSFCLPKVTVTNKEFLNELSYESSYRKADNQTVKKLITPRTGKILKLAISIEFCDKVVLNESKSFMFQSSFFQIESESGANFECIGTSSYGKLVNSTTPYNISGVELKSDVSLIFNVPEEGSYTIKYLGKTVGTF